MPYASLHELPPAVRKLPVHAQEIFRAAFNAAWANHATTNQEDTAFRIAWAAVKKRFRKVGECWVDKREIGGSR